MFVIKRIKLEIETPETSINNIYGFDIPLKKGLNIIAGKNSKGKSTIGSCLYYGLGMEELLGTKNENALGKALKKEFDIYNIQTKKLDTYKVLYSKVYIEIENNKGEIATISRYINSGQKDKKFQDLKTKKVLVYNSTIENINSANTVIPLFLRNNNNNSDDFGFYHWLSSFIDIELPEVMNTSTTDKKSLLYLQTIFSAFFIEQTKGWSDFFATIPYFGIPKNKEKVVEFILDLKELESSSKRDLLEKEEKNIIDFWNKSIAKLEILTNEYGGEIKNLPNKLTAEKGVFSLISFFLNDEDNKELQNIDSLIKKYTEETVKLEKVPIKNVGENKEYAREKLENVYKEQIDFMSKFDSFNVKFNLEKKQKDNIEKHLVNLNKELSAQKGIQNIIEESILITDVYTKCPTCTQNISDDLLLEEGVNVEKLSLDQNITYLQGQKKIIESSIKSLSQILAEKKIIRKYYLKKQREFEEEIKVVLKELIADDRDYSAIATLHRVRLEKRLTDLNIAKDIFDATIEELKEIAGQYKKLLEDKLLLENLSQSDITILNHFETVFKNNYLFPFKYTSNKKSNIFLQISSPFKYFPVFKYTKTDSLPQSIKTNSSASDFVRTIWAYSLALLTEGKNHPGVLIFDEPGQHSVSSESLKQLFEKSAKIKDRQIIIFTSVEKTLIKDENNVIDKLNLEALLQGLKKDDDYNLYNLPENGKSIELMK